MYIVKQALFSGAKAIVTLEKSTEVSRLAEGEENESILRFSLGKEFWKALGFEEGDVLSEEQIEEVANAVKQSDAVSKALDALSYSNHSRRSLITKLKVKYKIDGDVAEEAADYCVRHGYIDEEYQAEKLARCAVKAKNWGARRVVSELCAKGYPKELSKRAACKVSRLEYDEALKRAIKKKTKEYPADYRAKSRLFASLANLGHSPSDADRVLSEIFEEID